MTIGLQESRLRQRRRRRIAIIKWILILVVFVAVGVWAFRSGARLAEQEVAALRAEIARLTAAVGELRQERDALTAARDEAVRREQDWQTRYRADVPTGKAQEIFALVQQRLAAGVAPDRLAFVVKAADNKDQCEGKPSTKRFILPTAISADEANDSVGFADGAIRVTGTGEPARDSAGNPHGWFDPAKPVTLRFTQLGGRTTEATGKLPLYHSVVQRNSEYRFAATAEGPRGFVYVTMDRCKYP